MNKFKTAAAVAILTMLAAAPAVVHAATEITATDGYTISADGDYTLTQDITGSITVNAGVIATLDLNGHNITVTSGEGIDNYGSLMIKDSSNSAVVSTTDYDAIFNTGTLTIDGGTFSGQGDAIYNNNGTLTINDGTYNGVEYGAIYNYGTIVINNGTFNGTSGKYCTIYNYGPLTVKDGVFSGAERGIYNGINDTGEHIGSATIEGGTITGVSYGIQSTQTMNISGGTFTATSTSSSAAGVLNDGGTAEISNGEFNGVRGGYNTGTLTVTGGTFKGLGTSTNYALYNQGNLTVKDGTFTHTDGNTRTNYGLYCTASGSSAPATVTIDGGTFNGYSYGVYNNSTYSTVTINGGSYSYIAASGSRYCVYRSNGTIIINDGTFTGRAYGISTINGGTFNTTETTPDYTQYSSNTSSANDYVNAITVKGGTFNTRLLLQSSGSISGGTVNGAISGTSYTSKFKLAAGEMNLYGYIANLPNNTDLNGITLHTNENTQLSATAAAGGYKIENDLLKYAGTWKVTINKGSNCNTIKYDVKWNDGTQDKTVATNKSANSYVDFTKGETIIISPTQLVSATDFNDYVFKGWYTNATGQGDPITTEQILSYTPTANVTLYAVFESPSQNVNKEFANTWLEANGGYSSTSFNITSEDDMTAFAHAVNLLGYNFSGKTVTLTKDLDFSNKKYYMIGNGEKTDSPNIRFAGTFDGGNHTISHITLSNDNSEIFLGLFGYTGWATIKDLTVKDSSFTAVKGSPWLGVFVGGTVATKFYNCKSIDNTIDKGNFSGGLVGHSTYDTVNNAVVTGLTIASISWKSGGVLGYADQTNIDGATVSDIKVTSNTQWLGSIAGHYNYTEPKATIKNCNVNTPSLYFIGSTYSNSVKDITLSEGNTVIAEGIVNDLSGNIVLNITDGAYTVNRIANKFGNGSGSYTATVNITGGTFNGISTVYNKITDLATANIDMNNTVGLTEELLSQCTDAGGFVQDSEGNWVLEKANVIASAPDTQSEKLRTNIDAYVDEEGYGNLRVITDVELVKSVEIEKFGTWFIPTEQYDENKMFEGGKTVEQEVNTTMTFADAQFAADLMKIPAEYLGTSITAVSYVKPAGDLEIKTVLFATTINEAMQHHRDLETTEVD